MTEETTAQQQPEAPFSVSWTPGKTPIITFRPEGDVVDWIPAIKEFRDLGVINEIAAAQTAIDAAFLVVTQLGGQVQSNSGGQAPAQQAGGGDGRSCPHGVMRFVAGKSKAGKDYKRYDCPSKVAGCVQWG